MALFVTQLIRIVFSNTNAPVDSETRKNIFNIVDAINEMFNVIILRSIRFYFFCFTDNININIYLARESLQQ